MKKDFTLQINTAQTMADMQFMSYEERGMYITLICAHHQYGYIPQSVLMQITGGLEHPEETYPNLMMHLTKGNNGNYVHIPTGKEMQRRERYSKEQSERAKKRWNKDASADAVADAEEMPRDRTDNSYTKSVSPTVSPNESIEDPLEDLYLTKQN